MTDRPDAPDLPTAIEAALPEALATLPTDLPPPPALDAAVLAVSSTHTPPPAPGWPRWTTAVALAAGVLLGVGLPSARETAVVLTPGAHLIEGPARVTLPGGTLLLDGTAAVRFDDIMEPVAGGARDTARTPPLPEPSMFTARDLLATSGGAAVTLAVLTGAGTWTASDMPEERPVRAGEALRVAAPDTPRPPTPVAAVTRAPITGEGIDDPADLRRENDALKASLAERDFEVKALRGQLAAYGGAVSEWPDDLPEAFEPERFTSWAEAVMAEVPGFGITEVDCGEFPCLVHIEATGDAPRTEDGAIDWEAAADAFQDQRPAGVTDDDKLALGISVQESEDDDGRVSSLMTLYNVPKDRMNDGVQERMQVRTRDAAQRLPEAQTIQ